MTIGDRLRTLRKENNLTLEEMAKKLSEEDNLSLSKGMISRWENGVEPRIDVLRAYAKYFGVSLDYLLSVKKGDDLQKELSQLKLNFIPFENNNGSKRNIPIVGTVVAGPNGYAYQNIEGYEPVFDTEISKSAEYIWLKVSGESMIGDGINSGDLALIELCETINNGSIYAIIVNGEEGTLKHVTVAENTIILTSSNSQYPPRILSGQDLEQVKVVGRLVQVRKFFNQ